MVPHGMIWSSQTSRWWVGCYIWYCKEGTGQVPSPPRPIIAVPNVTAHPPTASVPITVSMYNGPLLWIIEEESGISKISIAVCLALFNTTLKATPQLSWQTLTCFEKHMFVLSDLRIYYQIIRLYLRSQPTASMTCLITWDIFTAGKVTCELSHSAWLNLDQWDQSILVSHVKQYFTSQSQA